MQCHLSLLPCHSCCEPPKKACVATPPQTHFEPNYCRIPHCAHTTFLHADPIEVFVKSRSNEFFLANPYDYGFEIVPDGIVVSYFSYFNERCKLDARPEDCTAFRCPEDTQVITGITYAETDLGTAFITEIQ